MTTQSISGATVWPEDYGTGASVSQDAGDYVSAGHIGTLAQATGAGYAHAGLSVGYNPAGPSVDIGAGVAFVEFSGSSSVQDPAGDYAVTWDHPITMLVSVPAVTNLALDADAVNELFLAVDPSGQDSARYEFGSGIATPTDPHVKLAEIDTSTDTSTDMNTSPAATFADVSVATLSGGIVGGATLDSLLGENLSVVDGALTATDTNTDTDTHVDVSDDGSLVASDVSGINVAANIAATYDGNGAVTLAATDTNTDTRVNVSNGGSEVVADATDINFATNLTVTDDGDGSVSVDASGGGGGTQASVEIIASGSVTLSDGTATVATGVEEPIDIYLDPSNGGANAQDIDVVASARYDSSASEIVVEIAEDSTLVGNPTVGYQIVRAI